MKRRSHNLLACVVLVTFALLTLNGCADSDDTDADSGGQSVSLPETLFLTAAPQGARSITDLKANAKEGDEVVVRAVIGGRKEPFVVNRAVMTVVAADVTNACLVEGDPCATPWDYCCVPPEQLLQNMATVQIVGPDARPLTVDLNRVGRLKPLKTVVIRGTVGPRTDPSSLVINATGIFVEHQQG